MWAEITKKGDDSCYWLIPCVGCDSQMVVSVGEEWTVRVVGDMGVVMKALVKNSRKRRRSVKTWSGSGADKAMVLAQADIENSTDGVVSTIDIYSCVHLTAIEAGSPSSGAMKVIFWWGFTSWLVNGYLFTRSLCGLFTVCVCRERERRVIAPASLSFLIRILILLNWSPAHRTSLNILISLSNLSPNIVPICLWGQSSCPLGMRHEGRDSDD